MATITTLVPADGVTEATKQWKQQPILLSNIIDFADALVAKGSALAAADVIEALRLPAGGYYVHFAGLQCITPDDATTLTVSVGTGAGAANWVSGFDQAAAAAGAYATMIIPGTSGTINFASNAGESIDITFATLTGTLTVGKVRVFALVTAVTGEKQAGLANFVV
jgi:hypothetical protein